MAVFLCSKTYFLLPLVKALVINLQENLVLEHLGLPIFMNSKYYITSRISRKARNS